MDEIHARRGVTDTILGYELGDNPTPLVDSDVELTPPSLAVCAMFRGGPLPLAPIAEPAHRPLALPCLQRLRHLAFEHFLQ